MPPSLGDRLAHIIEAIEGVRLLLDTTSKIDLASNRIYRLALERELEIICEASRHVPAEIKSQETTIDWRRMTDLGNRLRHAYHDVQLDILLHVANHDLAPLKAFVERVLAKEGQP